MYDQKCEFSDEGCKKNIACDICRYCDMHCLRYMQLTPEAARLTGHTKSSQKGKEKRHAKAR